MNQIPIYPYHDRYEAHAKNEFTCIYCKSCCKYGDSVGRLECCRHTGPRRYTNKKLTEYIFKCCNGDETSYGCQVCDHTDHIFQHDFVIIPLYYIEKKIFNLKKSSVIERKFYEITEKTDTGIIRKKDLFKSYYKIRRIQLANINMCTLEKN